MRIKQISVKKLFGMFDHVIPLNMDDRMTIIHGVNGIGKTVLLTLIDSIFNGKYYKLRQTRFEEINLDFDNNSYLNIKKSKKANSRAKETIELYFHDSQKSQKETFLLPDINASRYNFSVEIIHEIVPGLEILNLNSWLYLPKNEILDLEEVVERFQDKLLKSFGDMLPGEEQENYLKKNDYFQKLEKLINVCFIESQRFLNVSNLGNSRDYGKFSSKIFSSVGLAVDNYSREIAENLQATLAEYGKLSQSLDRTFPGRVIESKKPTHLTVKELQEKLVNLETQRNHLIELGLLNKDEDSNFQIPDNIDDSMINFISVYVKDVEDKLKVFKDIATKINLFKNILNKRLSYKQLKIDQNKGFIFMTDNQDDLSPHQLSSGEQHQIIMLYELLFKAKPNSLILIDEPEISLHVEWQVHYLEDLQKIIKLVNCDVLIATHSPDIINDRWDLTVQLKGHNQ